MVGAYPVAMTPRRENLAVVPAYNEEATVGRVLADLREHAPAWDVLVVDDGSTDETARVAAASGAHVVRLPFNLGIGGAVQTGFAYAEAEGYERLVQVDGDGQHAPSEIARLEAGMDADASLDMICGSRFVGPDGSYRPARSRRLGIQIFAFILSRIVPGRITDPTSGFRLYNRRAIRLFARDYPHDYPEVEAVLMLHFHRLRMREVPVRMFARGGGVSSISPGKSVYYMVKVLLAIFVGLLRARPVVVPGQDHAVRAQSSI